jgi:hypothetical protein
MDLTFSDSDSESSVEYFNHPPTISKFDADVHEVTRQLANVPAQCNNTMLHTSEATSKIDKLQIKTLEMSLSILTQIQNNGPTSSSKRIVDSMSLINITTTLLSIKADLLNFKSLCNTKTSNITQLYPILSFKNEQIPIEIPFVLQCLNSRNIKSDILMLKSYYIDSYQHSQICIKCIGHKKYKYWNGIEWLDDDLTGSFITNTLVSNLVNKYTEVNCYEQLPDYDAIVLNQLYIDNITKKQNTKMLFTEIIQYS